MDRRGLQLIKIKDGFEIHQFAGINIVIDKTEIPEKALFSLNETGLFIWNKLKKGTTLKLLVQMLQAEYDVGDLQAKEDIEEFLQNISEKGILEE